MGEEPRPGGNKTDRSKKKNREDVKEDENRTTPRGKLKGGKAALQGEQRCTRQEEDKISSKDLNRLAIKGFTE